MKRRPGEVVGDAFAILFCVVVIVAGLGIVVTVLSMGKRILGEGTTARVAVETRNLHRAARRLAVQAEKP